MVTHHLNFVVPAFQATSRPPKQQIFFQSKGEPRDTKQNKFQIFINLHPSYNEPECDKILTPIPLIPSDLS